MEENSGGQEGGGMARSAGTRKVDEEVYELTPA
jgi:hypothetical protein